VLESWCEEETFFASESVRNVSDWLAGKVYCKNIASIDGKSVSSSDPATHISHHYPDHDMRFLTLASGQTDYCLQCFDAVGWVAGRASGL